MSSDFLFFFSYHDFTAPFLQAVTFVREATTKQSIVFKNSSATS
jgi:hypothetical protein